jgi:ABC-2 type transport system permease protein
VRAAWFLAGKDLLQTRRDRMAAIFTIVLPIIFMVFFGYLLGGSSNNTLPVAVADQDGTAASRALVTALEASPVVIVKPMTPGEADTAVANQKVAAGLVIPKGYAAALDAGTPVKLTFVSTFGSTGAQSVQQAVDSVLARIGGEHLAASAALTALPKGSGATPDAAARERALSLAAASLATPSVVVKPVDAGTAAGQIPQGFDQSSPGMLMNWILFSLLTAATGLVVERKTGALQRLLTTRATKPQIIGGKVSAMFVITFLQQILLIAIGQFVFGVDYLRDPVALLAIMVSLSLFAATLGLLFGTVFQTEPPVIATTVLVSMLLTALGGGWFPLEITGPAFRTVAHLQPTAWILDAFHGIILKGWGLSQVLPAVGVTLAYVLVCFGVSIWRFRFE